MNSQLLSSIESSLNSDGVNYTVFLKSYTVSIGEDGTSEDCVRRAIGYGTVAVNFSPVSVGDLIDEIQAAINFEGDESAGPSAGTVRSVEFAVRLAELGDELRRMAATASGIERFEIQDGHPSYPVFWDFAFVFRFDNQAVILIGSASD